MLPAMAAWCTVHTTLFNLELDGTVLIQVK